MKNWRTKITKLEKEELVEFVEGLLHSQEEEMVAIYIREMKKYNVTPKVKQAPMEVIREIKVSDILNK